MQRVLRVVCHRLLWVVELEAGGSLKESCSRVGAVVCLCPEFCSGLEGCAECCDECLNARKAKEAERTKRDWWGGAQFCGTAG